MTGCRPDSSQQQIKDGEARPPVPGDPARALRHGPRMAPLQGGLRIEDGVKEPLTGGWGGTHSRCSLNCSVVAMSPKSPGIRVSTSQKYLCSFHDTKLEIGGPTSPLNQAGEGHAGITPWVWEPTARASTIFQPSSLAREPAKVQPVYVWQVYLRTLSSTT